MALLKHRHVGVALKLSAAMVKRGFLKESLKLFGSLAVQIATNAKHSIIGNIPILMCTNICLAYILQLILC